MRSPEIASIVSGIINRMGVAELLHYRGCKDYLRNLSVNHKLRVQLYDPDTPKLSDAPIPSQMVACVNVLNEIDPDQIDNALDDLKRVTKVLALVYIKTKDTKVAQEPQWWLPKLWKRFDLHTFQAIHDGFFCVLYAKEQLIEHNELQRTANSSRILVTS